jgi:hypothetical protein
MAQLDSSSGVELNLGWRYIQHIVKVAQFGRNVQVLSTLSLHLTEFGEQRGNCFSIISTKLKDFRDRGGKLCFLIVKSMQEKL